MGTALFVCLFVCSCWLNGTFSSVRSFNKLGMSSTLHGLSMNQWKIQFIQINLINPFNSIRSNHSIESVRSIHYVNKSFEMSSKLCGVLDWLLLYFSSNCKLQFIRIIQIHPFNPSNPMKVVASCAECWIDCYVIGWIIAELKSIESIQSQSAAINRLVRHDSISSMRAPVACLGRQ